MADADHSTAVVVPLRSFSRAKERLADLVDDHHRVELVRAMAERVIKAAHPTAVFVVTDDPEVTVWAREQGASVVPDPGQGLDGAARAGVDAASKAGHRRAALVHGDLPLATDLTPVLGGDGVRLVPDRRGDGTNVVAVPTDSHFAFAYGPGSFERHRQEAERCGLAVEVIVDPSLAFDLDVPHDVHVLRREHPSAAQALGLVLDP